MDNEGSILSRRDTLDIDPEPTDSLSDNRGPQDPQMASIEPEEEVLVHPFVDDCVRKMLPLWKHPWKNVDAEDPKNYLCDVYGLFSQERVESILLKYRSQLPNSKPDRSVHTAQEYGIFCQLLDLLTQCGYCGFCPGAIINLPRTARQRWRPTLDDHMCDHGKDFSHRPLDLYLYVGACSAIYHTEQETRQDTERELQRARLARLAQAQMGWSEINTR